MTSLAFVAGRNVTVAEDELAAARRRALLIVAAGGDPHRELTLDDAAVTSLAAELDAPDLRERLDAGLDALDADGLPLVAALVAELRADPDLAWRAYATALLAEELGGD